MKRDVGFAMFVARSRFPDPREAGVEGLVGVGADLEIETLVDAYSHGIFPWPQEGYPLLWFSPEERGILDFGDLHLSRSFQRTLRRDEGVRISFDENFAGVIKACAAAPRADNGTWILPTIQEAYLDFHKAGFAHSVEAWRGETLVGGLYGVEMYGVFSGESMFHLEPDASKRCLYAMIEKLRNSGFTWMDTQMVTPVVKSFGGRSIPRSEFLARLHSAHAKPCKVDWRG